MAWPPMASCQEGRGVQQDSTALAWTTSRNASPTCSRAPCRHSPGTAPLLRELACTPGHHHHHQQHNQVHHHHHLGHQHLQAAQTMWPLLHPYNGGPGGVAWRAHEGRRGRGGQEKKWRTRGDGDRAEDAVKEGGGAEGGVGVVHYGQGARGALLGKFMLY